jgi:hypothetical protein
MTASWYNRRLACVSFDVRSYAFIASIRRWNTNREWDVEGRTTWVYTNNTKLLFYTGSNQNILKVALQIVKFFYTFLHFNAHRNSYFRMKRLFFGSRKSSDVFPAPIVVTVASEAEKSTTAIQLTTVERTKQFQNEKYKNKKIRTIFFSFYICWFPSVCDLSLNG